jgi:hypothetical protein
MKPLQIFTSQRPLTEITGTLFLAHAGLTVVAAGILGQSTFLSWSGLGLVVLFDCAVWASLRLSCGNTTPILLTTAWFILLFFLPRLSGFQIFPAPNVTFVALQPFTQQEITRGLAYITAGFIALLIGLLVGDRLLPNIASKPRSPVAISGIVVYGFLAGAATIYVNYFLAVSVYSLNSEDWGSRSGWLAIVFNTDIALIAAITWLMLSPGEPRKKHLIAVAVVFAWLILSLLTGSRGGALRIMLIVGLAAIAIYGNPITSLNRVLTIVILAFVASSALYPLGTFLRLIPSNGENAAQALSDHWFRIGPASEREDASPMRRLWAESEIAGKVASVTSPVITRLGLIDYPITIINRKADASAVEHYLAISYGLKNFANNLVPGEIFPDYDIMTSRVFNMVYRGYGEQHLRSYFLSEPWTLWGYSWLKGGPAGGLAIILFMSALMQVGYAITIYVSRGVSHYAAVTYLFVPVIGGGLQLFGLDHALTITAHFTLALTVMLVTVAIVDQVSTFLTARYRPTD